MFICAGNTFLTSKMHSFRKMELTVNNEWTSISSLVQIFEVVNWPYITKVTAYYNMAVSLYLNTNEFHFTITMVQSGQTQQQ